MELINRWNWTTEIDQEANGMTRPQIEERLLGYIDDDADKDRRMISWFMTHLKSDDAIGCLYKMAQWAYWEGWAMATLQDRLGLHDIPDAAYRDRQAKLLTELMDGIRGRSPDKCKSALRALGVDLD